MGAWLRMLAFLDGRSVVPLYVGTALLSMATPLSLNGISVIANLWFPDGQRATATALMGLSQPLGILVGLGITGVLAAGLDTEDLAACFDTVRSVTLAQNAVVSVLSLLVFILFREKPAYPPSKMALVRRVLTGAGLSDDFAVLRKNWNYLGNAWIFSVFEGTFFAIGNLLSPLFGATYTATEISLLGAAFVTCGVLATGLAGVLIDRTGAFLGAIRAISIVGAGCLLSAQWVIPYGNFYITLALCAIMGAGLCPILPAGYSLSVFLTHPIPPAVSNGFLMCCAQAFSVISVLVGGRLLAMSFYYGCTYFCVLAVTAVVAAFCMR